MLTSLTNLVQTVNKRWHNRKIIKLGIRIVFDCLHRLIKLNVRSIDIS